MARMGDWRNNKDEEIELDGIGGVNILVKADVHRSGERGMLHLGRLLICQVSTSPAMRLRIRPKPKDLQRWLSEQVIKS